MSFKTTNTEKTLTFKVDERDVRDFRKAEGLRADAMVFVEPHYNAERRELSFLLHARKKAYSSDEGKTLSRAKLSLNSEKGFYYCSFNRNLGLVPDELPLFSRLLCGRLLTQEARTEHTNNCKGWAHGFVSGQCVVANGSTGVYRVKLPADLPQPITKVYQKKALKPVAEQAVEPVSYIDPVFGRVDIDLTPADLALPAPMAIYTYTPNLKHWEYLLGLEPSEALVKRFIRMALEEQKDD